MSHSSRPAWSLRAVAIAGVLWFAGLAPCAATALYGVFDDFTLGANILVTIDPLTGAYSRLGTATLQTGNYAPVFDPATNTIFSTKLPFGAASSNTLLAFDAITGAESSVLVTGDHHGTLEGLTFDPVSGTLYGVFFDFTLSTSILVKIDPVTGAYTRLGTDTLQAGHYAPVFDPTTNTIFSTKLPFGAASSNTLLAFDAITGAESSVLLTGDHHGTLEGLTLDPVSGKLYGVFFDFSVFKSILVTIDPVTGAYTRLGTDTLQTGNYAPVFDPATNTIFSTELPFGAASSNTLLAFDATTGAESSILINGAHHGTLEGLVLVTTSASSVSVPEPPTMLLFAALFGMVVGTCRRRRVNSRRQ